MYSHHGNKHENRTPLMSIGISNLQSILRNHEDRKITDQGEIIIRESSSPRTSTFLANATPRARPSKLVSVVDLIASAKVQATTSAAHKNLL